MSWLDRALRRTRRQLRERAPAVDVAIATPPPAPDGEWRAAVVGIGGWGKAHARVLDELEGVRLAAICDRDPQALDRLPEPLRPPRVRHFDDLGALLAGEGRIDLLSIATNTPSHVPLARQAIAAGVRRVVVEKPPGTHLREVDALAVEASAAGARVSVNLARRWSADYAAIRAYLERSDLGPLRHASAILGHGGLGMSGIHFLDLFAYFAGDRPARRVWGHLNADRKTAATWGEGLFDPPGWCAVELDDGTRGFFDLSADLEKRERFVVLRCARGRVEIDEQADRWCVVTPQGRRLRYVFQEPATAGRWLHRHLAEAFGDRPPRMGLGRARAALEMVLAAHASSRRGGAPVDLPLGGEDRDLEVPFP